MSEYSNQRRDKAIANEVDTGDRGHTRDQMCAADGCPNRWAVKREGRAGLCSAHDAVADSPRDWPRIAQQQQWDEAERARMPGDQHQARNPCQGSTRVHGQSGGPSPMGARSHARRGRRRAPDPCAANDVARCIARSERRMTRAEANRLIERAMCGEQIPEWAITLALQATGDLPADDRTTRVEPYHLETL